MGESIRNELSRFPQGCLQYWFTQYDFLSATIKLHGLFDLLENHEISSRMYFQMFPEFMTLDIRGGGKRVRIDPKACLLLL